MYERFYNLRERPFSLSPDPDYLYPSRVHKEALSYLRYGIEGHAGFIVITGEIGSGKTTLLQAALRSLDRKTSVSRIVNTMLDPRELLEAVMLDFGVNPGQGRSKPLILHDLARFLVEQRSAGRLALLLIDEAQNLSLAALEEIRMLSNLETEKSKLIQIALVGQPNLRDVLARPELEQLRQRVTVSYHLQALDSFETAAYVNHRLRRAALGAPLEFSRDVTDLIHLHSQGIPRKINVIADAVLLFGYGEEQRSITVDLTYEVIEELETTGVIAAPAHHDAVGRPVRSPAVEPPPPVDMTEREERVAQRERQIAEQQRVLMEEYRLMRMQKQPGPAPEIAAPRRVEESRPAWPPPRPPQATSLQGSQAAPAVTVPPPIMSAGRPPVRTPPPMRPPAPAFSRPMGQEPHGVWSRLRRSLFGAAPAFEE